jgi:hypothetical protein
VNFERFRIRKMPKIVDTKEPELKILVTGVRKIYNPWCRLLAFY